MATVFWDRKGILLPEFMAPGTTITSEVYCGMLHKLRRSIQNKRRGMLTKGVVLLHNNAWPHTAARTNALIKRFNWEIFEPPSLQSGPGAKWLPSLLQDEGLVGYPALPLQRRVHGWSQQLAAYLGGTVFWRGTTKTSVTVQVPKCGWQLCGEVIQWCM